MQIKLKLLSSTVQYSTTAMGTTCTNTSSTTSTASAAAIVTTYSISRRQELQEVDGT